MEQQHRLRRICVGHHLLRQMFGGLQFLQIRILLEATWGTQKFDVVILLEQLESKLLFD